MKNYDQKKVSIFIGNQEFKGFSDGTILRFDPAIGYGETVVSRIREIKGELTCNMDASDDQIDAFLYAMQDLIHPKPSVWKRIMRWIKIQFKKGRKAWNSIWNGKVGH